MTHFGFEPDAGRGAALDLRMHDELRDSLSHLREVLTSRGVETGDLDATISDIGDGAHLSPMGFALYFDLAWQVAARDHSGALETALRLRQARRQDTGLVIEADLADAPHPIARRINSASGEDGMALAPITTEMRDAFATRIHAGLALIHAEMPDLHDEITGIVRQIVLSQAPKGAKFEFDGASHYQYWGLLLLNPNHHATPLAVVEVLAHEAAHSLLFGLTVEEPLVFNPDDELFPSPLRADPRPMDGIYHATYVSARMAWAMDRMAASPRLSQQDRKIAAEAARKDRENFRSGYQVVQAHGRLSDTGAQIMDGALAFMQS